MEAYKYTFRNCRQWTSAINLYRGAFTNKSKDFWADPATKQKIRNIKVRDAVRSFGNIYQVSTFQFKAKAPFLDIFGTPSIKRNHFRGEVDNMASFVTKDLNLQ